MFAWIVGEVDWAAGDAAGGGVEAGPVVGGLEHVPVGQDVEVLGQEGVVGVAKDVPGVRGVDFGEEVVAVTGQDERFVPWELGVEEVLRVL